MEEQSSEFDTCVLNYYFFFIIQPYGMEALHHFKSHDSERDQHKLTHQQMVEMGLTSESVSRRAILY